MLTKIPKFQIPTNPGPQCTLHVAYSSVYTVVPVPVESRVGTWFVSFVVGQSCRSCSLLFFFISSWPARSSDQYTRGIAAAPGPADRPAILANSKFPNSKFQSRSPALLANSKFPDSKFQSRPPALLANSKCPDSKFQSRPPALLGTLQTRNSQIPNSNPGPQRSLQTRNSQIPNSNPGPQRSLQTCRYLGKFPNSKFQSRPQKAPKAKRFRIPRVRRLKLQFPYCKYVT